MSLERFILETMTVNGDERSHLSSARSRGAFVIISAK